VASFGDRTTPGGNVSKSALLTRIGPANADPAGRAKNSTIDASARNLSAFIGFLISLSWGQRPFLFKIRRELPKASPWTWESSVESLSGGAGNTLVVLEIRGTLTVIASPIWEIFFREGTGPNDGLAEQRHLARGLTSIKARLCPFWEHDMLKVCALSLVTR
jgi:hypothetical protein